jgi:hypothetical protein
MAQLRQVPIASGYGLGLDLLHTGLWLAPAALVFSGMAPVAATISRRLDARVTLPVGALTMTLAYVGRVFFSHSLWQIVLGLRSVGTSTVSAGSAAVLALGLHSVAGTLVPTYASIAEVFWMAAAASSVAVLLSISAVPDRPP